MGFPGFGTRRTVVVDPVDDREVVIERRSDETMEEYEARRAAADARLDEHRVDERRVDDRRVEERRGYEQGRRDQRRIDRAEARTRRRGGGGVMVGLLVVVVAAVGVLWLALAAREGSFAGGGAVVDQKVAQVTEPARVAAADAVDRTGAAVSNAGQALEAQGERIREKAR